MERFFIKEGLFQIVVALSITLFLMLFISDFFGYISLLITFVLLYIYRLPSINKIPSEQIISPVSGKVIAIDKVNGNDIIHIELDFCNTSLIISPENSKIEVLEYKKGLNLDENTFKAKKLNTFVKIKLKSLVLDILVGKCNTLLSISDKKKVKQYDKIGVLVAGSLRIILNKEFKSQVKVGQKIKIAETILA